MKNRINKYRDIYILNLLLLYFFVSLVKTDTEVFNPVDYECIENKYLTELVLDTIDPISFYYSEIYKSAIDSADQTKPVLNSLVSKNILKLYETLIITELETLDNNKESNPSTILKFKYYNRSSDSSDDDPSSLV